MRTIILALAAGLLTASSAAALEQRDGVHVTPPIVPHPMPQGAPYLVVGDAPKPVFELRYGVIHGKRVLLNARTMEVVYVLHP